MNSATGRVDKAPDLFLQLHTQGQPLGVSALGRSLDMPKFTFHRFLAAPPRKGMVERDARARYQPGTALVALGLGVLERDLAVQAARPILYGYDERAGETVLLVGVREADLMVVHKHEGPAGSGRCPSLGR